MNERWVEARRLRGPVDPGIWDVDHAAHPLLDPAFADRPSRQRRLFRLFYDRIRRNDGAYERALAAQLQPPGAPLDAARDGQRMAEVFREVEAYLREVGALLPATAAEHVASSSVVAGSDDLRQLLTIVFTHPNRRVRFEAQRKLYLARLFLEIDQSRHIQDGPKHQAYFEELLKQGLWRWAKQTHEVEVGYRLDPDSQKIEYTARPRQGLQTWTFHSVFVEREVDGVDVPLDILYYNCRFKRTVDPVTYEIIDGRHRVLERRRWGELRRQNSGPIVSKMIRKGINNADEISDILGAMFIVHDDSALDDLLRLLDGVVGSTVSWRNVVDTLTDPDERTLLNVHSGRGYQVFKGDVDLLYPNLEGAGLPYRFRVEVQIYTLEAFLRTVCGAHDANHLALKLRQFLYGLAPRLFPRAIYGEDWLRGE